MDAYWNHFMRAADLAPHAIPDEPELTPIVPPLQDPPWGFSAGMTPSELTAARIARHQEALATPEEPPATRAMLTAAAQDFTVVRNELAGIQDALGDIRDLLAEIRDELAPRHGPKT